MTKADRHSGILLMTIWGLGVLCSCSDRLAHDDNSNQEQQPICLRASINNTTTPTRFTITQDSIIHLNETVYTWTDEYKNNSYRPIYHCWTNISDGNGFLHSLAPGGRYYPFTYNPVRFTSVHGNFRFRENTAKPASITHTVLADQQTQSAYLRSDLLYADTSFIGYQQLVKLCFYHELSRIEVCVQPYGSITNDSLIGARMFIENIYPSATLDLQTQRAVTEGTPASIEIPLKTIAHGAPVSDFIYADYGEAVIPPQQFKPTRVLFRMQLASGCNYYFSPDTTYTFKPGKRYRFHLLARHLIRLEEGVEHWEDQHKEHEWSLMPIVLPPELLEPWDDQYQEREWSLMNIVLPPELEQWDEQQKDYEWSLMHITLPPDLEQWTDQRKEQEWSLMFIKLPSALEQWTEARRDWILDN